MSSLDSLGISSAVFVGNSSPAEDMTYLAEHHADRVAGLVYLANAPFLSEVVESESTGALAYALSATQPPSPFSCRPRYLDGTCEPISVPALTFVGESGTRGMEGQVLPLMVAQMVGARGSERISDHEARAFLERLSGDEVLKEEVATDWAERVAPAIIANERAFQQDFGDNMEVVRLPVPVVTG